MFSLSRRTGGALAVVTSALMVVMACGSAAATPTPAPTNTSIPPTAAAKATTAPATAVPTTAAATAVPAATATTAPAAPTASAFSPHYGGTITLAQTSDPPTFDIYATTFSLTTNHTHLTHNRLIRVKNLNQPENGTYGALDFQPDLATSWDVSGDGLTYTFHIRQGATFQNVKPYNGREFTAMDAMYSLNQMETNPQSVFQGRYANIATMTTPDKYTLVMTTHKAIGTWLLTIQNGEAASMEGPDEAIYQGSAYGTTQASMVGTGPFIADGGQPGSKYHYSKNPTYWEKDQLGNKLPYVDAVVWLIIPDASAREAAFTSGQIDQYAAPSNADAVRIQKGSANNTTVLASVPLSGDAGGFTMNMNNPIWQNLQTRQAIQALIPYDRIISDLMGGYGARDGCIPTSLVNYSVGPTALKAAEVYDPKKAESLLTQAGYSAAKPLTFDLTTYTGYNQSFLDIADALNAEMTATGMVKMTIKPTPVANGRPQVIAGNFTAVISTHVTVEGDSDGAIAGFDGMDSRNYSFTNDPQINTWYNQQAVDQNQTERESIIKTFDAYCLQNVSGVAPVPKPQTFTVSHTWLQNYGLADVAGDEDREKFAEVIH
jgi:peptide/nickel transport system substrate-binding protein